MQAGEPYASDDPIMIATARMGIMRTVIAITLPKKAPATFGRGQLARLFRPYCLGTNGRSVRRALCRFQNANDAPPPDAQNVTASRQSCEVPSFPSFPQTRWNQRFSCVLSALRPSKQPAPKHATDRTLYFLASAQFGSQPGARLDEIPAIAFVILKGFAAAGVPTPQAVIGRLLADLF
jgi:hypothetical protein